MRSANKRGSQARRELLGFRTRGEQYGTYPLAPESRIFGYLAEAD
jgi:hypothetical protein